MVLVEIVLLSLTNKIFRTGKMTKNAQNLSIFSIIGDKVISLNKTEFKFEKSILLLC
ncbi:hypothetical protein BGP_6476 [Beggiatoa sp. PS]|nr:hypothetical protein BGP_6476 [Beggiatoa sp. PS]